MPLDNPLPFIGHLSLARQLRILLMVFGAGILLTIARAVANAASNDVASAQTQIASRRADALAAYRQGRAERGAG